MICFETLAPVERGSRCYIWHASVLRSCFSESRLTLSGTALADCAHTQMPQLYAKHVQRVSATNSLNDILNAVAHRPNLVTYTSSLVLRTPAHLIESVEGVAGYNFSNDETKTRTSILDAAGSCQRSPCSSHVAALDFGSVVSAIIAALPRLQSLEIIDQGRTSMQLMPVPSHLKQKQIGVVEQYKQTPDDNRDTIAVPTTRIQKGMDSTPGLEHATCASFEPVLLCASQLRSLTIHQTDHDTKSVLMKIIKSLPRLQRLAFTSESPFPPTIADLQTAVGHLQSTLQKLEIRMDMSPLMTRRVPMGNHALDLSAHARLGQVKITASLLLGGGIPFPISSRRPADLASLVAAALPASLKTLHLTQCRAADEKEVYQVLVGIMQEPRLKELRCCRLESTVSSPTPLKPTSPTKTDLRPCLHIERDGCKRIAQIKLACI